MEKQTVVHPYNGILSVKQTVVHPYNGILSVKQTVVHPYNGILSVIKNKELSSYEKTRRKLKRTLLSERSQPERLDTI